MPQLPAPKDISDEELLKLLEAEDPSGFRIPMSLGEPHAELDKGTVRLISSQHLNFVINKWLQMSCCSARIGHTDVIYNILSTLILYF